MGQTATYYDLLDAFAQPGCPVCRHTLATVDHWLGSVNYEFVNDPGFRSEIEPAWGFCNLHAERWLRQANVLGTAVIYDVVLARLTRALGELKAPPSPSRFGGVASILGSQRAGDGDDTTGTTLRPPGRCPACRVQDEQERMLIRTLLQGLAEPAFCAAYEGSTGLCLPHLRRAVGEPTAGSVFSTLRAVALARQERLHRQLREVIRKHDYRFREEPIGEERGATERVVQHVAGAPGLGDR